MSRRDKRQQIMHAAERLFRDRRFHEVTLDEVAHVAKVGKGTIYRHFEDKDDLFFQTAAAGFDDLCELLRRKVPDDAPFAERLLSACVEVDGFFRRRHQLHRMMQAEEGCMARHRQEHRGRWVAEQRRLTSALGEILAQGASEGDVRTDVPADVLARYLLGMLRTRGRELRDMDEAARSREVLLELFLRGAGPHGGPAGTIG